MEPLSIRLFGRFAAQRNGQSLEGLDQHKMQEILSFLLLQRDRDHPREVLASLFWSECSTGQSRSYLRRVLWQIQNILDACIEDAAQHTLLVEPEWVRLNPKADLWLDVAWFEQTGTQFHRVPGQDLDSQQVDQLKAAVELYRGDLLEGWYQDWCLRERERLQSMYLAMLEKLMTSCEVRHEYDVGLSYGARILRYDRAHERTHQRMMHLAYLSGDRTAALRQFEHCTTALEEELGVKPDESTLALYASIRASRHAQLDGASQRPRSQTAPILNDILCRLRRYQALLNDVQCELQEDVQTLEDLLRQIR